MLAKIVPGLLGGLDYMEQVEVVGGDGSFLDEPVEAHHSIPEVSAEQNDRQRLHLAGLDERQEFEAFVERAEATGEDGYRPRAKQEVHLAEREIRELQAERRRDIGVGELLVRQHDIEADRILALVGGAAIDRKEHTSELQSLMRN